MIRIRCGSSTTTTVRRAAGLRRQNRPRPRPLPTVFAPRQRRPARPAIRAPRRRPARRPRRHRRAIACIPATAAARPASARTPPALRATRAPQSSARRPRPPRRPAATATPRPRRILGQAVAIAAGSITPSMVGRRRATGAWAIAVARRPAAAAAIAALRARLASPIPSYRCRRAWGRASGCVSPSRAGGSAATAVPVRRRRALAFAFRPAFPATCAERRSPRGVRVRPRPHSRRAVVRSAIRPRPVPPRRRPRIPAARAACGTAARVATGHCRRTIAARDATACLPHMMPPTIARRLTPSAIRA